MANHGKISGRDAFVSGMALKNVTDWSVDWAVAIQAYSDSSVPGGSDTLPGTLSQKFTINGNSADCGVFPDGGNLSAGFVVSNEVTKFSLVGSVIVEQVTYTFDVATGGPVKYSITGGVQNELAKSGTGTGESLAIRAESGIDCEVVVDDSNLVSGTYSTCIKQVQLMFKRPLTATPCKGHTTYTAGNLEASITIQLVEADPSLLPLAQNSLTDVQVITNGDGDYWHLNAIRWGAMTGYGVNRATAAPIGYSVTGMWSGKGINGDGEQVIIATPAAVTLYEGLTD